jgi:hypothetical protein
VSNRGLGNLPLGHWHALSRVFIRSCVGYSVISRIIGLIATECPISWEASNHGYS